MTTLPFTLLMIPDGRAILTTTRALDDAHVAMVKRAVDQWKSGEYTVLLIDGCEVVQVSEIDLDLAPAPAGALS